MPVLKYSVALKRASAASVSVGSRCHAVSCAALMNATPDVCTPMIAVRNRLPRGVLFLMTECTSAPSHSFAAESEGSEWTRSSASG